MKIKENLRKSTVKEKFKDVKILDRFFAKISIYPDSCWIWNNTPDKYGHFNLKGCRTGKAHRISWEYFRDKIPKGFFVCHKCDVKGCVNPDHLFIGTQEDNMDDMVRKRKLGSTRLRKKLNDRKNTKLTYEIAQEIREIHFKEKCFYKELATKYNTSINTISCIILNKIWI